MGMALAERLSAVGHEVHVFERADQPGGLATWQDFGPFVWDRFYHVILPSDLALVGFLRRIGLADRLQWRGSRTGYYVDGKLWSLSNAWEFLRFPLLSPWNKLRLAWTVLHCSRLSDWRLLERVTVEEFLVRLSGRSTFEKFWKPLLLAKLGEHYRRVSAVFIWTYVKRLFSARDPATQKEQLGYVSGGYRTVFQALERRIAAAGGRVATGVEVTSVEPDASGLIRVALPSGQELYDRVIFTGPASVMRRIVSPALVDAPAGTGVEYLGVVCLVLITRRPVVPFYVVNISDESVPFTGVIGMSSIVGTEETAGLHLTYCPKYVLSSDAMLRRPDEELLDMFMTGFALMFPGFSPDDVVSARIHRADRVQPLQVKGYSGIVQAPRTRSDRFFVVNTAQFVHSTLNNNEVIAAVDSFLERFGDEFAIAARDAGRGDGT